MVANPITYADVAYKLFLVFKIFFFKKKERSKEVIRVSLPPVPSLQRPHQRPPVPDDVAR